MPLQKEDIKNEKNSDILFILGSGSSINKISDRKWDQIEKHDSIGFNFWLIHDFIPNYFKFELDLSGRNKRTKYFYEMFDSKWHLYKDKLIIYNHFNTDKPVPNPIQKKLKDNQILYPKYINIPGKNLKTFNLGIKYFQKLGLDNNLLFAKRSSITMLISFGIYAGYKKIILCGIDLNNTDYFYDDDYYKRYLPQFSSGQPGKVHLSFDSKHNPFTIDKIISTINDSFICQKGTKLYVLDKSSALYPGIPVFN